MRTTRLLGRLVFGSLSFCVPASGVAWLFPWLAVACLLAPENIRASSLVLTRDKNGHVSEPTQKAIIVYDQGREDMVLQFKYEGPAQEFGWLIPVPGLPEVRQGSMDCFYDLSRLTQEPLWPEEFDETSLLSSRIDANRIKAVEIKTLGAFEVTVLFPQDAASMTKWLTTHHFSLPKEKRSLLDGYISNHWHFVAVKIDPNEKGFVLASSTRQKPPAPSSDHKGRLSEELPPLIISFPSDKCRYPIALSAVNAKPSEVAVFVISGEPLMSRAVFEKMLEAGEAEKAEWIKQGTSPACRQIMVAYQSG